MKFTKKSILVILLVCVCMIGCFANSFVNADDTMQPLATPAIEEPEKTEPTPNIEQEAIAVPNNNEETVELCTPIYLDIYPFLCQMKRYVSVNSYGQKLVKLEFDFADSDNYGTEYIRKLLSDLLGDIKDEQYVSDDVFYDFTHTTRGDKVLFLDKHPLGIVSDVNSPYDFVNKDGNRQVFGAIFMEIVMDLGDMPALENVYVKQDLEVLYLSEEQYEKVLSSGLCKGSICYADYDYIRERDGKEFPSKLPPTVSKGIYESCESYEMKVEQYKSRYYSDKNGTDYFIKWYDEYVALYIVE